MKLNGAIGTNHKVEGSQGGSVAIEARLRVWRTEDLWFESRHRKEGLLICKECRLALEPTQPPLPWALGSFPGVKQSGRTSDYC